MDCTAVSSVQDGNLTAERGLVSPCFARYQEKIDSNEQLLQYCRDDSINKEVDETVAGGLQAVKDLQRPAPLTLVNMIHLFTCFR